MAEIVSKKHTLHAILIQPKETISYFSASIDIRTISLSRDSSCAEEEVRGRFLGWLEWVGLWWGHFLQFSSCHSVFLVRSPDGAGFFLLPDRTSLVSL